MLTRAQSEQTSIFIANHKHDLGYPSEVARLIGKYTGLAGAPSYDNGINTIDTYGHRALDYHYSATDPIHQLLRSHGAINHNPITSFQKTMTFLQENIGKPIMDVGIEVLKDPKILGLLVLFSVHKWYQHRKKIPL